MPRPGQQAYRRKRAFGTDSPARSSSNRDPPAVADPTRSPPPRAQCLPIANLPEDFDGVPMDGEQYLAMVVKANGELPFATRMEGWKSMGEKEEERRLAGGSGAGSSSGRDDQKAKGSSGNGSARHPALPNGSWEVLFPLHFQNYREEFAARWPQTQTLPYPADYPPLPAATHRSEWFMFINGYPLSSAASQPAADKKGKGKKVELTEEELMNGVEEDEEALINGGGAEAEMEEDEAEVDDAVNGDSGKGKKGPPREPLLSVLQQLNSGQAIKILGHFAHWLSETIHQLPPPIPSSPDLLPTQAGDSASDPSTSTPAIRPPNPLPPHYSPWILSLLLLIDQHLDGNQISTLRELARSAMKVAGWRWVRGVVSRDVTEDWVLGGKGWDKLVRDKEEQEGGPEEAVDETLARCWVIVHAVAAGWGQRDLLDDLENLFK
ncbi:hypothetical protein IAT38_000773 [Cryptococcus sp. DSM 104549]